MENLNNLSRNPKQMTILHVEDDSALAYLVRAALEGFGFRGEILQAGLVAEAFALLAEREGRKAPLDLMLVDMQLPDGNGLDVLRKVRASPVWHRTPLIVLSGETSPGLINEVYALGGNCFLPKLSRNQGALGSVKALYECWIDGALLPQPSFTNQVREVLSRAVQLRARTAQFYLGLARSCSADSEEEEFWLDRALIEGNLSNLLTFFQWQISNGEVPPGLVERSASMQVNVEKALTAAEVFLTMHPSPTAEQICRQVLDLVEAWNEEVFAEVFGALCSKSPKLTAGLQARAVCQLRELANHVLRQTREPELCRRAKSLCEFAVRLEAEACGRG
jgi:CheY-like chemotaxis protein